MSIIEQPCSELVAGKWKWASDLHHDIDHVWNHSLINETAAAAARNLCNGSFMSKKFIS